MEKGICLRNEDFLIMIIHSERHKHVKIVIVKNFLFTALKKYKKWRREKASKLSRSRGKPAKEFAIKEIV